MALHIYWNFFTINWRIVNQAENPRSQAFVDTWFHSHRNYLKIYISNHHSTDSTMNKTPFKKREIVRVSKIFVRKFCPENLMKSIEKKTSKNRKQRISLITSETVAIFFQFPKSNVTASNLFLKKWQSEGKKRSSVWSGVKSVESIFLESLAKL